MNITVLTFGTRGDVEPYLALAVGLQKAGHRVRLVAPSGYADWIRSYGVDVHVQTLSVDEHWRQEVARSGLGLVDKVANGRERAARAQAWLKGFVEDYWAASADADLILQGGFAFGGIDIARERGIPILFAFPHPLTPTREYPCYRAPLRLALGAPYNYLTHWISMQHAWRTFGAPVNAWRGERLNLPPWPSYRQMTATASGAPMLYAYSPNVIPKSADWTETDHVVGYWFLEPPPGWEPPAEIMSFLEAGPPPIHVGFGSMRLLFPERATRMVLEAIRLSGQRAVISVGAGEALRRRPAPPNVCYIDGIPYGWLFPRMAAVVHHGGAGTNGAVLRAGVPGVVVPIGCDQFGWSQRVRQLGVGVGTGSIATTTAGRLARMIRRAIEDGALRQRAAAMGETIRAENGVDAAVSMIERYAGEYRRNGQTEDFQYSGSS